MTIENWRARYDHLNAETDRLRAEVERLREDAARSQKLYDERQDDWIAERENLQTLNMQLVKNHDAMQAERDAAQKRVQDCETRMMRYAIQLGEMQAERDAARAEEEKLRDKAELLDEIITNRISLSCRDGIPVTAHIWSARTDNGFGTGNTLPEALAALRAAKAGGK